MKIEHLLEMPQAVAANSPLGRAQAREKQAADAQSTGAFGQMQQQLANPPTGGNTMATTPVSKTNTAASNNPNNFKVIPGGKGTAADPNMAQPDADGRVDPSLDTDELDAIKKNAGIQPVTTTTDEPAAEPEADDAQAPKEPSAAKKAWDYANSAQSGADVQKFGAGMADAGGSLSRGAQTVAQGTGKLVKGIAPGVADVGHGIGHALGGVGSAVKGVGDVAAQAAGGITQTVGSALGGLKHGWDAASRGQKFGGGGYAGAGTSTPAAPAVSGGASGSNYSNSGHDDLADLKATISSLDRRMRGAGI